MQEILAIRIWYRLPFDSVGEWFALAAIGLVLYLIGEFMEDI
jgi:hypothetical protein